MMNRAAALAVLSILACGSAVAEEGVEAPPALFVVNPQSLAQERSIAAAVQIAREELARAGLGVPFAPGEVREIALREAAMIALERNITLKRADLAKAMTERTLQEARAVFDPVFGVTTTASFTRSFKRVNHTDRWKPHTERVLVGRSDSKGLFDCTYEKALDSSGDDRGKACHVITFGTPVMTRRGIEPRPRSPVIAIQFNKDRPEGYYPDDVVANDPAKTAPAGTGNFSAGLSVFQQLPWGSSVNLTLALLHQQRYFGLNSQNGLEPTYGTYGRPFFSNMTIAATVPLPGTKNFGAMASAEFGIKTASLSIQAAELDLRGTLNDVLFEVDSLFWSLVGTVLRLQSANDALYMARSLHERVERRVAEGAASEGDRRQADAQYARMQSNQQAIYQSYVTLSGQLAQRLDVAQANVLLVPVGFLKPLSMAPVRIRQPERILESPTYQRQALAVRIAGLVHAQRVAQTRPDLSMTGNLQLRQSGSFGYADIYNSLAHLIDTDSVTATLGFALNYPIGNRAARAGAARSGLEIERQELLLRKVAEASRNDFENAKIRMSGARARLPIAKRAIDAAAEVYERSERLEEAGLAGAYETLSKLTALLDAESSYIQALVDLRQSESALLNSMGAMAEYFGLRTAQTPADEARLNYLRQSGDLQYWGGPR